MFDGLKNMGDMISKAKEMKRQMTEMQNELKKLELTETAVDGMLSVTVNGELEIMALSIDEKLLDPKNRQKLETAAIKLINKVMQRAKGEATNRLTKITGGLNIPGLT
jgi:DNA-binding YbaB/EbfC family protein